MRSNHSYILCYLCSTDQGPPHNSNMSIKDVIEGSGTICGNGWVCNVYFLLNLNCVLRVYKF